VTGSGVVRLGFLYPGYAAEDDYAELVGRLSVSAVAEVVHTSLGELGDQHTVEALQAMGEHQRLADGAAVLRSRGVAAVLWACTSGSFTYGWDGAARQAAALREQAGVPASSTSLAFVRVAQALGIRRVTVAATYPAPVAERFTDFLRAGGIEVLSVTAAGIMTATEAGEMSDEATVRMIAAVSQPDADAVLVPDTALHTARLLPHLAQATGKQILTANQVTVWEAVRLAGLAGGGADASQLLTDLILPGATRR
jgi:maleate cis-trans isomerase